MLPEQSPSPWPANNFAYLFSTVQELKERYLAGYPTECDGDAIALQRGPMSRIAQIIDHL